MIDSENDESVLILGDIDSASLYLASDEAFEVAFPLREVTGLNPFTKQRITVKQRKSSAESAKLPHCELDPLVASSLLEKAQKVRSGRRILQTPGNVSIVAVNLDFVRDAAKHDAALASALGSLDLAEPGRTVYVEYSFS